MKPPVTVSSQTPPYTNCSVTAGCNGIPDKGKQRNERCLNHDRMAAKAFRAGLLDNPKRFSNHLLLRRNPTAFQKGRLTIVHPYGMPRSKPCVLLSR